MTTANNEIAVQYLDSVATQEGAPSPNSANAARELEELRSSGKGVADLTRQFTSNSLSGGEESPSGPPKQVELGGSRSKATSVDAMKKYREAKEAAALTDGKSRGERPAPPPKIDLYK